MKILSLSCRRLFLFFFLVIVCCYCIQPATSETIADSCIERDVLATSNLQELWPRLQSLKKSTFFRTFKVNLHSTCPFWNTQDEQCAMRGCAVCGECEQDDEKRIQQKWEANDLSSLNQHSTFSPSPSSSKASPFDESAIRSSVHFNDLGADFREWSDEENCLWIVQDHVPRRSFGPNSSSHFDIGGGISYINILVNPESYTGYVGEKAHRIWRSIYEENCFVEGSEISTTGLDVTSSPNTMKASCASLPLRLQFPVQLSQYCAEQRFFYRLLSGLHSAISAHISEVFPTFLPATFDEISASESFANNPNIDWTLMWSLEPTSHPEYYAPNLQVFQQKLGKYEDRIENLHFAFVVLLRAVKKATPMLLAYDYSIGNSTEDHLIDAQVHELLESTLISSCSTQSSFDETQFFSENKSPLKLQFREKFRNISRIMDCVGCEKCKLHGKLQILGLGTALKILFNDAPFALQRNEVMALIHTLAKFSNALKIVYDMKIRESQQGLLLRSMLQFFNNQNWFSLSSVFLVFIAVSSFMFILRRNRQPVSSKISR